MATSFWELILSKNGNTKVFCFQSKSRLNDKINFGHCSGRRKHERDPYIIMSEMWRHTINEIVNFWSRYVITHLFLTFSVSQTIIVIETFSTGNLYKNKLRWEMLSLPHCFLCLFMKLESLFVKKNFYLNAVHRTGVWQCNQWLQDGSQQLLGSEKHFWISF